MLAGMGLGRKRGGVMGEMLKASDVAAILQIGNSKAYSIIREMNQELKAAGFYTIRGRISRVYFEKRFFGGDHDRSEPA